MALGRANQKEITEKLQLEKGGHISHYLNNLIKSGFIQKDLSWKMKTGKLGTKALYRLSDNYSRFYLKYILPQKQSIETGNYQDVSLGELHAWPSIIGLQMENLVLNNRKLIKKALDIHLSDIILDNPYYQPKTQRTQACQIDYLIQTKQNCVYICEIKYSKNPVETSVIQEMKQKIDRLATPKHFSIRPVLIHINGVTERPESKQYFSYIININALLTAN